MEFFEGDIVKCWTSVFIEGKMFNKGSYYNVDDKNVKEINEHNNNFTLWGSINTKFTAKE